MDLLEASLNKGGGCVFWVYSLKGQGRWARLLNTFCVFFPVPAFLLQQLSTFGMYVDRMCIMDRKLLILPTQIDQKH